MLCSCTCLLVVVRVPYCTSSHRNNERVPEGGKALASRFSRCRRDKCHGLDDASGNKTVQVLHFLLEAVFSKQAASVFTSPSPLPLPFTLLLLLSGRRPRDSCGPHGRLLMTSGPHGGRRRSPRALPLTLTYILLYCNKDDDLVDDDVGDLKDDVVHKVGDDGSGSG